MVRSNHDLRVWSEHRPDPRVIWLQETLAREEYESEGDETGDYVITLVWLGLAELFISPVLFLHPLSYPLPFWLIATTPRWLEQRLFSPPTHTWSESRASDTGVGCRQREVLSVLLSVARTGRR